MGRQLHVVSHTHWDREWHRTFQQFRLRLVQLIDTVLDLLADDDAFPYFMLDGQTIVLQDYVEIRPERRAELRRRIREGRLLIGPWYVHPDEFLVSGEALVRNLLQGLRDCEEWGGRMAVGYVPDQFGHIAQLPQIWRGFSIDSSIVWRGVDPHETGLAFTWRALDGSTVLTITLPDGYNHAEHLPGGAQALAERLRAIVAAKARLAGPTQPVLIMHGGDHALPNPRPLGALRAAQDLLGRDYTIIQSTLPRYKDALQASSAPVTMVTGELRNPRTAPLLPGVTSSRMWIKQRNAAMQMLLERQAEPLGAVAGALGATPRDGELRQGWRYLLQNQPHDSIAGCSIDQVHREMHTRYDWAEQIASALRDDALATLAAHVDSILPGAEDPRTLALTIFNGADAPQPGIVTTTVRLAGEATSYELVDPLGQPVPHHWEGQHGEPASTFELPLADVPDRTSIMAQIDGDRVLGMGIQDVSMRTSGTTLHVEITMGAQALLIRDDLEQVMRDAYALIDEAHCTHVSATIYRAAEAQLTVLAPPVPPLGYCTLLLRPRGARSPQRETSRRHDLELPAIANERYRVEANVTTGSVTIVDRASGLTIAPANVFVDTGEAGDLYTHAAPRLDTPVRASKAPHIERLVGPLGQTLRIEQTLHVPSALAESRYERSVDRVPLPLTTTISVLPGDPLVRFQVDVENVARDHRLRVHATLPFATDHAHAADAFAVVRRAAQPNPDGAWAEQPTGTAPHQGAVAIHGDSGCCIVATRGLPEYEVLPQADGTTQLALTLLRCTGWLSRGDIPERPRDAGPPLPTPEAQCLGSHRFSYALLCGGEPWQDVLPAAQAFTVELCATLARCAEGTLPHRASLIEVTPALVRVSALKVAEDGRGAIVRLYNPWTQAITATIRLLLPITRATMVDLAEQDGEALAPDADGRGFALPLRACGIVSVRIDWHV